MYVVLDNDCIYCILTFLSVFDVVKCSLINKQFCDVHKNELLWKELFENIFCHIKCDNNFYTNYVKQIKINISIFNNAAHCGYTTLDMAHKEISYISQQIKILVSLETLFLCDNKLQTIPIYLCKLSNLETLNLSYNKLKFISPEIKGLIQLNNLFLNGNELISLPVEIGNLEYLKWLEIDNNKIRNLPIEINNLKNLRQFSVDYELKDSIPNGVLKIGMLKITYVKKRNLKYNYY